MLIDIGKETTGVSIFLNGNILNSFNFPFGGDDLTQALQENLKILFDEAEEMKIKYGLTGKSEITNILLSKIETALEDIYKKIEPFLKNKKNLPPVIAIGGSSKMDGLIEIIEKAFNIPVSMRSLESGGKISDTTFACSLGLMKYGAKKIISERACASMTASSGFPYRVVNKIRSIVSEYF